MQTSAHMNGRNEITLVWGLLRLAPINTYLLYLLHTSVDGSYLLVFVALASFHWTMSSIEGASLWQLALQKGLQDPLSGTAPCVSFYLTSPHMTRSVPLRICILQWSRTGGGEGLGMRLLAKIVYRQLIDTSISEIMCDFERSRMNKQIILFRCWKASE